MAKPSRRVENRKNLAEIIPLKCPMLVHIDPCDACNLRCKFCFHQRNRKEKGMMDLDTYQTILNGLRKIGRPKTICLYKAGEPLLHPDIVQMVKMAKEVADRVWIKTNGLLLTPVLAKDLATAGLDILTISVIGPHGAAYKQIAGLWVDYLWLRNNIMTCYNEMKGKTWLHIKMADAGFTEGEKQKFFKTFVDCDDIEIEYLHQPSFDDGSYDYTLRQGFKQGTHGEPIIPRMVCPLVFYSLNFERDGYVTICSNDHKKKTGIGKIPFQTVEEIWNGGAHREVQKIHLMADRAAHIGCAKCEYLYMLPDNIDDKRQEIYERICN